MATRISSVSRCNSALSVTPGGCCAFIDAHRGAILKVNGTLQAPEQFAIDYIQLGPNGACCNGGSPQALSSWLGYGAPVLAAAPGVVVEVVDGLPDQQPVGTKTGVTAPNALSSPMPFAAAMVCGALFRDISIRAPAALFVRVRLRRD